MLLCAAPARGTSCRALTSRAARAAALTPSPDSYVFGVASILYLVGALVWLCEWSRSTAVKPLRAPACGLCRSAAVPRL